MNPFGDKGSIHLIDSLPFIQRLNTLRLRENDITDIGTKQLAIALKTNSVMISIHQIHENRVLITFRH